MGPLEVKPEEAPVVASAIDTGIFKQVEGKPNVREIQIEVVRESLKHAKRKADETFEFYKQRMRDTNKAMRWILRGRMVYNSANMIPYKVE